MMPWPDRSAPRMRGQVLPLVAILITLVCCFCALAVDLSGAYRAEAALAQHLEVAKDSVMADLTALKFADADPAAGPWVDDVARALSADGYHGTLRVWWVEAPRSATGDCDRLVVLRVEVGDTCESALAQLVGHPETTVSRSLTFWANPYSTSTIWRPGSSSAGSRLVYEGEVADGTWSLSHRAASEAEVPADVGEAEAEGLSSLLGGGQQ